MRKLSDARQLFESFNLPESISKTVTFHVCNVSKLFCSTKLCGIPLFPNSHVYLDVFFTRFDILYLLKFHFIKTVFAFQQFCAYFLKKGKFITIHCSTKSEFKKNLNAFLIKI